MKKSFLTLLIFCSLFSKGQNPLVKMWDKRFGGTLREALNSIQQTSDSGYILGGWSNSGISGDKTQAGNGLIDYWIVKIDSTGNKIWDKDFGGTDDDALNFIQQTTDGGYILGGNSRSGISGNKSQAVWGIADYWIIKIDSLGNVQWDRDLGGTGYEELSCIRQTSDGGYILGGSSLSGIGGNKTQPNAGVDDYWIIKTDSLGNMQWDKDFGGTDNDVLRSVQQTSDGGYILGGYSDSGISGDKTQANKGINDYWLVKTDFSGNKLWDKDFGGSDLEQLNSLSQTADGGYILGGWSVSDVGGDKTQPLWGGLDYWIVKTDSAGNKQWDKDFGASSGEEFYSINEIADGSFLISGDSYSPVSGNKSETNMGYEQTWILKTDSLGNVIWDKTVLTAGHDEQGQAIQTTDGCYIIANLTDAGIGGNKSEPSQGDDDFWIIKFCEILKAGFTSPDFICPGTCVDFINLSVHATGYYWSFPGANPPASTDINPTNICYSTPGIYDVQLIATNSNGSDTLLLTNYITVYPAPPPQSITQSGDTLFAIAGSASYQWYFNTNIINGATDYFYVARASGDYNVVATDTNGCEVEAAVFNVVASSKFEVSGLKFEVFPNPVGEKLSVISYQLLGTVAEISVYDILGVSVVQPQTSNFKLKTSIDVSELPPGLYYLEIKSSEATLRSKFVKQ